MKNNTLKYRVGELENKVGRMVEKLDIIRTNDLPHLAKQNTRLEGKLKNLDTKIKLSVGVNALQIIAVVIGIILLLK